MPRKKQKGPPGRSQRPGPGATKPGQASTAQSKPPSSRTGNAVQAKNAAPKKQNVQQNQRPIVPFLRSDRVLLIGEGEFCFVFLVMLFCLVYLMPLFIFFFCLVHVCHDARFGGTSILSFIYFDNLLSLFPFFFFFFFFELYKLSVQ